MRGLAAVLLLGAAVVWWWWLDDVNHDRIPFPPILRLVPVEDSKEGIQLKAAIQPLQDLDQYRDNLASINNRTFDPAPRTSHVEYNKLQPNEKYFAYSPSGGMGNQLIELINACVIANKLNRILAVPMLGSHTSLYTAYERLPENGRFPMDRILDFPHLTQVCNLLPLNISVVDFVANVGDVFEIFHVETPHWHVHTLVREVQPHNASKLVYFHGAGMYGKWMNDLVFNHTIQFVRFSPYLRLRAVEIATRAFHQGKFNAMHIRLGDYSRRWPSSTAARARYIAAIPEKYALWNRSLPLYVATDEPDDEKIFGPLKMQQKYKVMMIRNLPQDLLKDFAEIFPEKFRLDMLGILDQLVCSQAEDFIPIAWSSFSQGIVKIRQNRKNLFPESS